MSTPLPFPSSNEGTKSLSPIEDWDFPSGTTCNPNNPEECEACQ